MSTTSEVNSPAWWEHYFRADWEGHGGREQTRVFTETAIRGLDAEELLWLGQPGRSLCDWGCAMGDGVAALAQRFAAAQVCGLDSTEAAIRAARQHYPQWRFATTFEELLEPVARFDALLCSNCLEHFDAPAEVALAQLQRVSDLYLVLVPHKEFPLSSTHKRTWDEHTLPTRLGDFTRLYAKVLPVDSQVWPGGEQLLLVYGSPTYVAQRSRLSALAQEQAKWDRIYADMPLVDVSEDDVVTAFNDELLQVMQPLLPPGATVLEAGCGGGAQSLTLAQRGGYQVSLLDFSAQALDYARRLFAQHGQPVQTIEADAFARGQAEYDMVFNAGVLEHYDFSEQVRFVQGMASRSRRYVMVLVPNRACYWYWVWRLQKAAAGQWPYGKEVPLVDMQAVFESAGLQYLGQAFVGRRWSESFVQGLEGLSDELRDLILQAQRGDIVPGHTQGYLLAALGTVDKDMLLPASELWQGSGVTELRVQADQTALLADAVANAVAAQVAVRRSELDAQSAHAQTRQHQQAAAAVRTERDEAVRLAHEHLSKVMLREAEARQEAAQAVRLAQTNADAAAQSRADRDKAVREAQQQLESLRQQSAFALAQQQQHTELAQAHLGFSQRHVQDLEASLALMRGSLSWRITMPMRFLARMFRHGWQAQDQARLRAFAKRAFWRLPLPRGLQNTLRNWGVRWLGEVPRPATVDLTGIAMPNASAAGAVPMPAAPDGVADYFFWGVIDWHLRFQRPQHLAKGLAGLGRRVFYVSSELRAAREPGYTLEPLDSTGLLVQVHFQVRSPVAIYGQLPTPDLLADLRSAAGALLRDAQVGHSVQVVQHPFWTDVATVIPNSRCAYDCMDHHAGFDNTATAIVQAERRLIEVSEDVIVTSQWLHDEIAPLGRPTHLVRNGCEYAHFAQRPPTVYADPRGRRIIGYYGAIAPWMDIELVRAVARAHPDAVVLMIGADTTQAQQQLADESNIEWLGELPYTQLPFYTHAFDVALLPFQIIPLTLATNPVKVYEYLSAGLAVVCTELPETLAFAEVAWVRRDRRDFVQAVSAALAAPRTSESVQQRQAFAAANTWAQRVGQLTSIFEPDRAQQRARISVVVVTYNNIELTKACLASLEHSSPLEPLEVVVIDNASTDGTPELLMLWQTQGPGRQVVLNTDNRGFAAANNQGLKLCTGEFLCLLNNDTYVTPGWATSLRRFLETHPDIGLAGPVTNNIGNEARIPIAYSDMDQMLLAAREFTTRHLGEYMQIRAAAFFCAMWPRRIMDRVGLLDEAYGLGFFEDDDYCMAVQKTGAAVACCDHVFVHHHLSASFNKLPSPQRQALMDRNRALYESKWGKWEPHAYR